MRVLCVASHPDDEVLGVAGTLLRHKLAGDIVRVVLVNRCRPAGVLESEDAERVLGIPYTRLWDSVTSVEDIVNDWHPSIVYTHSLADLHHHHRELHERVVVACRPQSGVKCIYAFETPSTSSSGGDATHRTLIRTPRSTRVACAQRVSAKRPPTSAGHASTCPAVCGERTRRSGRPNDALASRRMSRR